MRRRADLILQIPVVLLLGVFAAMVLAFPHGPDQAIFALAGDALRDGKALYRDAWDIKPPGIFLLYAAARALLGANEWGIRVVELLAYGAMTAMLVVLSARAIGSRFAGVLGAAIALHMVVVGGYWHSAQAESFVGVLILAMVALVAPLLPSSTPPDARPPLARAAILGVLCGLCTITKPFFILPGLVCLAFVLIARRQKGLPILSTLGAFAAGFGVVLGATFVWLVASGAWHDFVYTFFVVAPEIARTGTSRVLFADKFVFAVWLALVAASNLVLPGLAMLVLLRRRDVPGGLAFWIALLGSLVVCVALQGKYYLYHFHAMTPVLGLLAGWGWWTAWQRAREALIGRLALPVLVVLLMIARTTHEYAFPLAWWQTAIGTVQFAVAPPPAIPPLDDDEPTLPPPPTYGALLHEGAWNMAAWIVAHTEPDDTIQVFGFEPLVYLYADRAPATSFLTNTPVRLTATRRDAERRLIEEMTASPPRVFVVARADSIPWTIDDSRSSADLLAACPALTEYLTRHYTPARRTTGFEVYWRTGE